MSIRQISSTLTEYSNGLRPIYEKVQQLLKSKQIFLEVQKRKIPIKIIQHVPKVELKLNIDRKSQFVKKRQNKKQNDQQIIYKQFNCTNKISYCGTASGPQAKTKSERMLNFLKANQSQKKLKRTLIPITPVQTNQNQRQSFTPMRPISRTSRHHQSVSGTSLTRKSSHNKSSAGGYSQIARLSQNSSNSNTGTKYLRKGHRMRQTLLKQIQAPEDIQQQKQLVYLKQYDQWVPASLASFKKLQLQHFLNILLGGKKNEKKQFTNFQPIYL